MQLRITGFSGFFGPRIRGFFPPGGVLIVPSSVLQGGLAIPSHLLGGKAFRSFWQ
jgi:hypothetical protein